MKDEPTSFILHPSTFILNVRNPRDSFRWSRGSSNPAGGGREPSSSPPKRLGPCSFLTMDGPSQVSFLRTTTYSASDPVYGTVDRTAAVHSFRRRPARRIHPRFTSVSRMQDEYSPHRRSPQYGNRLLAVRGRPKWKSLHACRGGAVHHSTLNPMLGNSPSASFRSTTCNRGSHRTPLTFLRP